MRFTEEQILFRVQVFLRKFGYLDESPSGERSDNTKIALGKFCDFYGIKDPKGLQEIYEIMLGPRCGVPDLPRLSDHCKWPIRKYTWTVFKYPHWSMVYPIDLRSQMEFVKRAFDTWQAVIPLDFELFWPEKTSDKVKADWRVNWYALDHGDGHPFDGPEQVLAHAFYPSPCGGQFSGHLHFDDSEIWDDGSYDPSFSTQAVALHEIGHLIGLDHSSVAESVMFPTHDRNNIKLQLHADDLSRIRALYGPR